jgi:ribosomal protein L7/L12
MTTKARLAFLASQKFEEDEAFRGAFLVTDEKTTPLEFRCTGSVRPTDLQKVLYGHILEQYVCVDLLATPLIQSFKEKPDLILVQDPLFLDLRPKIDIPILCLLKEAKACSERSRRAYPELNRKVRSEPDRKALSVGRSPAISLSGQKDKRLPINNDVRNGTITNTPPVSNGTSNHKAANLQDRLDIILTTIDSKKDSVIQVLSKIHGLKRSPHQIVEQLPYTVGRHVSRETAQKIRAHLEKVGATIKLVPSIQKSPFSGPANGDDQMLHSDSGRFEPLGLMVHKDFVDERSIQRALLNQIFKEYDLAEPFNRIAVALKQVHAQNLDTRAVPV